jgi:hypothetical protein
MADGLDLTPNRIVEVPAPRGTVRIGQSLPVAFIAGPCQLESRAHGLEMSARLREIADRLGCHMIYKTSFDKANRSSINTARGLGLSASLDIFHEIRETSGLPVITDVHLPDQCAEVAQAVDVLQIPAFLSRQTDLLVAATQTGKPINVKKGQFLAPWDMKNVVNKLVASGCRDVLVCERGVASATTRSSPTCAQFPNSPPPARRSCSTRRTPCSNLAGRAQRPAASASSCRSLRAPPPPSASRRSLSKRTRTRISHPAMAPTWFRSTSSKS